MPNDILVDDVYSRGKNVNTGQMLHILDHDFHVAGIVEHGKGARLFVFLPTLQDLAGAQDKAWVFFIKCERPDDTDTVMDEIRALLPRYEIRPLKDFITLMTSSNLPGLQAFINTMIGIAVAIGFLVIFLSMYTTIIERTREIGVLKSLGASKVYIMQVILSETTLLCVAGILVGIVLSYSARAVFLHLFPTLTILITEEWILRPRGSRFLAGCWDRRIRRGWRAARIRSKRWRTSSPLRTSVEQHDTSSYLSLPASYYRFSSLTPHSAIAFAYELIFCCLARMVL